MRDAALVYVRLGILTEIQSPNLKKLKPEPKKRELKKPEYYFG